MNQLAVIEHEKPVLSAAELRMQVNLIQSVMQYIMKKDTHYGVLPGCQQPTLYKAGSEVLLSTFRIAVEPEIEDLSSDDEIHYRVRALGRHQSSGMVVGIGIGECSSSEEKYKWRNSICDEEWDNTPEHLRRIKYGKRRGGGHYTVKQVRTQPADLANTILKMAKKRAQIDLTLTATAASDIFSQDKDDRPPESEEERPQVAMPQSRSGNNPQTYDNLVSEGQLRVMRAKLEAAGITEQEACVRFQIEALDTVPASRVNEILQWIENPA